MSEICVASANTTVATFQEWTEFTEKHVGKTIKALEDAKESAIARAEAEKKCTKLECEKLVLRTEMDAKEKLMLMESNKKLMQAELDHSKALNEERELRHAAEKRTLELQIEQELEQTKKKPNVGRTNPAHEHAVDMNKRASASLDRMKKKELQELAAHYDIDVVRFDGTPITASELRKKIYAAIEPPAGTTVEATSQACQVAEARRVEE